ncbi:MAG: aconitase X catalytic domain-containing protein [Nocardioides sp.]
MVEVAPGSTALTAEESAMLAGDDGPAVALAMRIVLVAARTQKAERLVPIVAAHVDGCLYHGPSSQDFVEVLVRGAGKVKVPTTLNVGGLDLTRPDLFVGRDDVRDGAALLMDSYVALGCQPTFTCAPYQLPGRPERGADVAWAESNAIVFGNSVIGLRTNRYGDLMDISAALTGRVPLAGLHVDRNRAARAVFRVDPDVVGIDPDLLPSLLGLHVSRRTGTMIPVLDGLQDHAFTEDWGKAFGAAAASGGGVAMFHVAGHTPEAPDLVAALQGRDPVLEEPITAEDLRRAHRGLTTAARDARLGGVSIGTPHLSRAQLRDIDDQLAGRHVAVPTFATTSRSVAASEPEAVERLELAGVTIVRDTCTYGPSKVLDTDGAMMTNSAKWAYYAPPQLGYDVVLASRADCVESAVLGRVAVAGDD